MQGDEIQLADGQRARITSVSYETNLITVDRVLAWTLNQGISLAYLGTAPDLGAYEFEPQLELRGAPGNRSIYLSWTVNASLPVTSTWTIEYDGPPGEQTPPITGIPIDTRGYTLSGVTNYIWYTVTLNAMLGEIIILSDTVIVMPTDRIVYIPLVLNEAVNMAAREE